MPQIITNFTISSSDGWSMYY
ncbi:hypothetical protein [Enterococcus durans]